MREIEAKILNIDVDSVVKRLEELGAQKQYDKQLIFYKFDYPDNRLSQNKTSFRLRLEEDITRVTFKEVISKELVKDEEEIEFLIDNPDNFLLIMDKIGFIKKGPRKKRRISYKFQDVVFDIDIYPEIPPLLEIETTSYEKVVEYAEKLGFKKEQLKPWSGKELFNHYGKTFL